MKSLLIKIACIIATAASLTTCASAATYGRTIHYNSTIEEEIIRLTNEQRAIHGLYPVQAMPALINVARAHSVEMITASYFQHESPTPGMTHPWDRVFSIGLRTNSVSENIFSADGYSIQDIATECVHDWMTSSGHRRNILDPSSRYVGVGVALHPSNDGEEALVTQEFTGDLLAH